MKNTATKVADLLSEDFAEQVQAYADRAIEKVAALAAQKSKREAKEIAAKAADKIAAETFPKILLPGVTDALLEYIAIVHKIEILQAKAKGLTITSPGLAYMLESIGRMQSAIS